MGFGGATLVGLLTLGLWPGEPAEFVAEYGAWEAKLSLNQDDEDCDAEGDCTTSTRTLEQVSRSGRCLGPDRCDAFVWPAQPLTWQTTEFCGGRGKRAWRRAV